MSASDDPFAKDKSSKVTVSIGGSLQLGGQSGGTEYLVKEYAFDESVLNIGDAFSCTIANIEGEISGQIHELDPVVVYMADASVGGAARTQLYTGRVLLVEYGSDVKGGSVIMLTCYDLGWHLKSCQAIPFVNLNGITIAKLLDKAINSTWGFAGFRLENTKNVHLKQGRQGVAVQLASDANIKAVHPRIQTSPGDNWAEHLIKYARRIKRLVNVSADGYLQVFAPDYKQASSYRIVYRKSTDKDRNLINVRGRPTLTLSGETKYGETRCYSTWTRAPKAYDTTDPNAAYFHGTFTAAATIPFDRLYSFMDQDQLSQDMATARAEWAHQRGLFDAWVYNVTMPGSAQGGAFFAAGTMAEISDTVHKVSGLYYVVSVRRSRTIQDGTTTAMRLQKPDLLAA